MNVNAYRERGTDFTQYRTFAWDAADALPTNDPRLDNNPFFKDHFEGAVEQQLATLGIEKTASGTPDLLLHYHVNVRQRFELAGADSEWPYCSGVDCQGRVSEYEAGTFVLDMVDASTKKVVWRGWAETHVDGVIDNQDWLRDHVAKAVAKMLRLYPDAVGD